MTEQSVDSPGADDAALIGLWLQLGFPQVERQADRIHGWVVVEFSVGTRARHYDLDALEDLLERMSEWQPTALDNQDGYTVQLHIQAPTAADALHFALCRHDLTATHLGATDLSPGRGEVLTLAEFEWSCQDHIGGNGPAGRSPSRASCLMPYEAPRGLMAATTPTQLADTIVAFVLAAGATVHLGPAPPGPDTVTAALGIGRRSEMYASGSTDTVAGLMVGPWLARLRADAW